MPLPPFAQTFPARHFPVTPHLQSATSMSSSAHLILLEASLGPAEEQALDGEGWRFALIQQGQGYLLAVQGPQILEQGDAVMLSPAATGVLRASQLGALQFDYLRFQPVLLADFLTPVERHYLESQETQQRLLCRVFKASDPIARRFREVQEMKATGNSLSKRSALLQAVAGAVGVDDVDCSLLPASGPRARERVLKRLAEMTESQFVSCSVEELAVECRCSMRHLSRLFRKTFGISLSARQTELRMQRAARLLKESDLKVSEIARECGYLHIGLFNSTFKKRWKHTPSGWRGIPARPIELNTHA